MQTLNLPTYSFRFKSKENKYLIFDIIRKKYVVLTPEEWVRQHWLHYLSDNKKYPKSLIAVEKQLKINKLTKRSDILIFDNKGNPDVIVECKAPSIQINQSSFDQIARYNLVLKANYLIVSNGLEHFYCKMNHEQMEYVFLQDIPFYN